MPSNLFSPFPDWINLQYHCSPSGCRMAVGRSPARSAYGSRHGDGAEHRNLGPGDWKSELFQSWQLQGFCVEPAEQDECGARDRKSLRTVSSI